jgi:GNAT superfamily N-acetyltransferase
MGYLLTADAPSFFYFWKDEFDFMTLTYDFAQTDADLLGIQILQEQNVAAVLSAKELADEGFVTARHDLDLLREMNHPFPHVLARDGKKVVGYALVMEKAFSLHLPVLIPMFEKINQLYYQNSALAEQSWFVMGQICIAKQYRGQGVFQNLYAKMRAGMSASFRYVITQIAQRNPRSIRAHEKVGFQPIHAYSDPKFGEDWVIVLWDWSQSRSKK